MKKRIIVLQEPLSVRAAKQLRDILAQPENFNDMDVELHEMLNSLNEQI